MVSWWQNESWQLMAIWCGCRPTDQVDHHHPSMQTPSTEQPPTKSSSMSRLNDQDLKKKKVISTTQFIFASYHIGLNIKLEFIFKVVR